MEFSDRRRRRQRHRRRLCRNNGLALWLTSACILLFAECTFSQQKADEDTIRTMLADQVAAWKQGDVEGYLRGYWGSDSTIFTSGGILTKGYREVLLRYKKHYDNREKMGNLEFSDLVVQPLSSKIAVATGVWQLVCKSDKPWGRFTLILEKKPEGWRITHDHTSSAGN